VAFVELQAQVPSQGAEELLFVKWFAHEVVATGCHNWFSFFLQGVSRERDDFDTGASLGRPNPPGCFQPVHHRHADIHPNQVGMPLLEQRHGFLSVGGLPQLKTERV
jgi:hypothetical protein